MNETQIVAMMIGLFCVVLLLLGFSATYGSGYTTVSQGVSGLLPVFVIFAIVCAAIGELIFKRRG